MQGSYDQWSDDQGLKSRVFRPGVLRPWGLSSRDPGVLWPGVLHPDVFGPGVLHPLILRPRVLHPGVLNQRS